MYIMYTNYINYFLYLCTYVPFVNNKWGRDLLTDGYSYYNDRWKVFSLSNIGAWTQGFMHAGHKYISTELLPQPFLFHFETVSHSVAQAWDPPASALLVAGITGVCHRAQPGSLSFPQTSSASILLDAGWGFWSDGYFLLSEMFV